MKTLISILLVMMTVGCATTPTMESVIGTYEAKIGKTTTSPPQSYIVVFLKNGKVESYDESGEKDVEGAWKLVEKEVHIEEVDIEEVTDILKIEPNGDLTLIARIEDSKRKESPKEKQATFKKLKE